MAVSAAASPAPAAAQEAARTAGQQLAPSTVMTGGAVALDAGRARTAAEAYLHEARVAAGYAQYQTSEEYADKATRFAQEAKKKAIAATAKPAEAQ